MSNPNSNVGQTLVGALRLSSDEAHERDKQAEDKRADYRRQYWQKYRKSITRVYGTLPPAEYEALKARAEKNERAVWQQLVAEARAYRSGGIVPTLEHTELLRQAIGELNHIGNNINQLTRLGHLQSQKRGPWESDPEKPLTEEVQRQLNRLEAKLLEPSGQHPAVQASGSGNSFSAVQARRASPDGSSPPLD